MAGGASEIYYDPYDFQIDDDPYPIWKRLRDERPLYRNERFDFFAVSRFADVEACSRDWQTFVSSKGTVLELIRADVALPRGMFIFEDPPIHDLHRGLMSRVFTPRRVAALEGRIREFCAQALDPFVGSRGFDYVRDFGADMPMRVISEMLGIPEADQETVRDQTDAGLRIEQDGVSKKVDSSTLLADRARFADYIEFRRRHPSDDLMTDLLAVGFVDENGVERHLDEDEIVNYSTLLAAAGNETTARLIGWTGYLLAKHPHARELLLSDRSLIPGAIEEILRYEAPSPVQARFVTRDVELHGETVAEGSVLLLLTASANRDERRFPDPDRFDVRRKIDHHLTFGYDLHFCLGAALARLEGRVALEEVLARFPAWEVDEENAERVRTSTVRGWHRLPVRFAR
ncbi:MAG: cytochrome P450 [Thermodesulfobacteriota bacterium]